jgi:hypothetical protein
MNLIQSEYQFNTKHHKNGNLIQYQNIHANMD